MNKMRRVARDRSLTPIHWVTDRPNFRILPVKGFYFLFLTEAHESWAEMKKLPPDIARSIHCVKQGQRQDSKQAKMLCVNLFAWIRGSKEHFLCFSFANKRGLPPNNLCIAFIVSFLPAAYCFRGSIPRQINAAFCNFTMQVISMRNVLKGALSPLLSCLWKWVLIPRDETESPITAADYNPNQSCLVPSQGNSW